LSLHSFLDFAAEDKRLAGFDDIDDRRGADGFEVFEKDSGVASVGWGIN
jgi:hypothetical protein